MPKHPGMRLAAFGSGAIEAIARGGGDGGAWSYGATVSRIAREIVAESAGRTTSDDVEVQKLEAPGGKVPGHRLDEGRIPQHAHDILQGAGAQPPRDRHAPPHRRAEGRI